MPSVVCPYPPPKAPAQCPTPSAHRSTPQRSPQRSEQGSSSSVNSGSSGTSSANVHVCACAGNTQQQLRLLKSQAFTVLSSTNGKRLLRLKQRAATSAPCIVTRQQAPAHPPAFSCHPDVLPSPPPSCQVIIELPWFVVAQNPGRYLISISRARRRSIYTLQVRQLLLIVALLFTVPYSCWRSGTQRTPCTA